MNCKLCDLLEKLRATVASSTKKRTIYNCHLLHSTTYTQHVKWKILLSFKHWNKTSSLEHAWVKTHKTKSSFACRIYTINIYSSLKFLKQLRITLTCLHEICFKLYTSFASPETDSTSKLSVAFRALWLHQGKIPLHISVTSHKAELSCADFNKSLKQKHSLALQVANYMAYLSCVIILEKQHMIDVFCT